MRFPLITVGETYGIRRPLPTTFNGRGLLEFNSPVRRNWALAEITMYGQLAAAMRLLRDPFVVHALKTALRGGNRTLFQHLVGIFSTNVALIFGDSATADNIKRTLAETHRRKFLAEDQPSWFVRTVGQREFTAGDPTLMTAVTLAFASAVARAHQACGILQDGQEGITYCGDIAASLGVAAGVNLRVSNLRDLHTQAKAYGGVPLMDREALAEAGVPGLLAELLATEVAPGLPLSALINKIAPLMWEEDRKALGVTWEQEDENMFRQWAGDYAERASRFIAQQSGVAIQLGMDETVLTEEEDVFSVAQRRFSYA